MQVVPEKIEDGLKRGITQYVWKSRRIYEATKYIAYVNEV